MSQAFPIFAYLLLPCIIVDTKASKTGKGFGDKDNRTINEQHLPEEKQALMFCKVTHCAYV